MYMKQETGLPKRKKNRLENYDYSFSGAYFITVCTKDRKALFWDEQQMDCVGEDSIFPYKCFDCYWTDEALCVKKDW